MATCGPAAFFVFAVALFGGTASTLLSKVMFGFTTTDSAGVEYAYERPLMQTFLMFISMAIALPLYYGYLFLSGSRYPVIKRKTLCILAAPACTDMLGTMFMMIGLLYVTVSVYQLVRCLVIVYVALLRRFVLKRETATFQWLGVFMNAFSVCIVSVSALFDPSQPNVLLGISFINFGCFIMACQLTLEEAVMSGGDEDEDDEPCPPLVVVGMEGLWGSLIMLTVIYPITYVMPGNDHGSYENFYESVIGLMNNPNLLRCSMIYVSAITTYNVSAIFITSLLESVWRSILENFRPIAVWGTDLALFYLVTAGTFGETWNGGASWLQVFGLILLLSGTATYNGTLRFPCLAYPSAVEAEKTLAATPTMDRITASPAINKGTPKQGPRPRLPGATPQFAVPPARPGSFKAPTSSAYPQYGAVPRAGEGGGAV